MQKNILVIFGGASNENEISVITGTMAANVLKGAGYSVIPLYIAQNGKFYSDEKLADISGFSGDTQKIHPCGYSFELLPRRLGRRRRGVRAVRRKRYTARQCGSLRKLRFYG